MKHSKTPPAPRRWRIMAQMNPFPGLKLLIVTDGCHVGYADITGFEGHFTEICVADVTEVTEIAVTGSPISCVLPCGSSLYLMTGDGPRCVRYFDDTRKWVRINPAEWPPVSPDAADTTDTTDTAADAAGADNAAMLRITDSGLIGSSEAPYSCHKDRCETVDLSVDAYATRGSPGAVATTSPEIVSANYFI
jgi:hypothetical protein